METQNKEIFLNYLEAEKKTAIEFKEANADNELLNLLFSTYESNLTTRYMLTQVMTEEDFIKEMQQSLQKFKNN